VNRRITSVVLPTAACGLLLGLLCSAGRQTHYHYHQPPTGEPPPTPAERVPPGPPVTETTAPPAPVEVSLPYRSLWRGWSKTPLPTEPLPGASATVALVQPSVVTVKQGKSTGSGVVVDVRGYILTNWHCVSDFGDVTLVIAGKYHTATIVAIDRNTDLALLRTPARGLVPLALTDAIPPVGADVLLIGCPYGYSGSVSRGIVSATGRTIELPSGVTLSGMIQTDAAVNPGSSGGPLVNAAGQWVGVATAMRGGANGIAFVTPAATVKRFLGNNLPR